MGHHEHGDDFDIHQRVHVEQGESSSPHAFEVSRERQGADGQIKSAPWTVVDNGKISWIAGGFQNQFGMESVVIASLCASRFSGHSYLTPRWSAWVLRHCAHGAGARADVADEAADRRVRVAGHLADWVRVVNAAVQDQEWRVPICPVLEA